VIVEKGAFGVHRELALDVIVVCLYASGELLDDIFYRPFNPGYCNVA
jgi:hypothetical protein